MASRNVSFLAAMLLLFLTAMPTLAADGCPAEASGFRAGAVNQEWELGDPIPSGDVLWEEIVVAGAIAEGLTLEEIAALFGVTTAEELYGLWLEFLQSIDVNLDGVVCFKPFPAHQNGHPLWLASVVDSNAKTSR
jgi:hypothetical protein